MATSRSSRSLNSPPAGPVKGQPTALVTERTESGERLPGVGARRLAWSSTPTAQHLARVVKSFRHGPRRSGEPRTSLPDAPSARGSGQPPDLLVNSAAATSTQFRRHPRSAQSHAERQRGSFLLTGPAPGSWPRARAAWYITVRQPLVHLDALLLALSASKAALEQ